MDLRIFTLPFDPVLEGFPDELVVDFCYNKKVHKLDSHFFMQEGRAYWSVGIHYELLGKGEKPPRDLDEVQKLLFERLREWRKEAAQKQGVPVYLIATNQQLIEIIQRRVQTIEGMKGIKGFGKGKIDKYGRALLNKLKAFYEEKQGVPDETNSDLPF